MLPAVLLDTRQDYIPGLPAYQRIPVAERAYSTEFRQEEAAHLEILVKVP